MDDSIINLIIWTVLFVGTHFLMAFGSIRKSLVNRLGDSKYKLFYTVISIVTLIFMVISWRDARQATAILWITPPGVKHIASLFMLVAFILLHCGFTTKNPTVIGQESLLDKEDPAYGITRITRHPALWAFTIWSAVHMALNGDLAALIFFSGFFILSFFGMFHIDQKRKASKPDEWERFSSKTSLFPFVAIIQKRNTFNFKEIGFKRIIGGIILFFVVMFLHRPVIGVGIFH